MPGSNENFEHLLDAQQKKEAQEAAKKGNKYDTREAAIANTLGKFDVPHDALDYLSKLGEDDQKTKADLETKSATSSLSGPEINKLDEAKGRLSANQTVATEVLRRLTKDADQRRADYQTKPFKELKGDITKLKVGVDATKRDLDAASSAPGATPDSIKPFENAHRNAQAKFQEAEDIYNARSPEELTKDAEDAAETAEAEANKRRESYKTLAVDKLYDKTGELYKDWDDLNKLTSRINRRGTPEEKAAHKVKLDSAAARWNEANEVLKEKEAAEQKRLNDEHDLSRRENSSSSDLQDIINDINTITLPDLDAAAIAAENELETARTSGDSRKIAEALRKRNAAVTSLNEQQKNLKFEEDALKKALDRESKDVNATLSMETFDIKSGNEYAALPPQEQAKYLEDVLAREDMAGMDFDSIDAKLKSNQKTSFKERAFYGAQFADRMMSGKVSTKEFPKLAAGNKDLFHMVSDRVTNSEQAKAMAEKYGTPMEKLLNWAKKDYRWLMILVALIAAAAGPVTTAGMAAKFALR